MKNAFEIIAKTLAALFAVAFFAFFSWYPYAMAFGGAHAPASAPGEYSMSIPYPYGVSDIFGNP